MAGARRGAGNWTQELNKTYFFAMEGTLFFITLVYSDLVHETLTKITALFSSQKKSFISFYRESALNIAIDISLSHPLE